MTTIHLTDAQRDTFAASGLIVIDGEYSADGGERALQRMQQMDMPQGSDKFGRGYHQVTGHPLLAPEGWRILTEPCGTCGGRGHAVDPYFLRKKPCPNPDCVGGRRVVTLTATCPTCDGDGVYFDDEGWQIRCGACDRAGVVTLGRFTIPALLPVVEHDDDEWPHTDVVAAGLMNGEALARLWRWNGEHWGFGADLPLDPLPHPGQFIARPERVV